MPGLQDNMIIVDELRAGYNTTKHLVTNEFARLVIGSDARFVNLVNTVGEDNIKTNHDKSKEVKNNLFTYDRS